MLCTLDRALNLASEAAGAQAARATQLDCSSQDEGAWLAASQGPRPSEVPLASTCAGVSPHFFVSSSQPTLFTSRALLSRSTCQQAQLSPI